VVVAGIDATKDALAEMEKGNLDVTVFQDAKGQGYGAVETAVNSSRSKRLTPLFGSHSSLSSWRTTKNT
jgi:inositol transport system substrate-binding protein